MGRHSAVTAMTVSAVASLTAAQGQPPRLRSAFVDVFPDQLTWGRSEWRAEFELARAAGVTDIIFAGSARLAPSVPPPHSSGGVLFASLPPNATEGHPLLRGLDARTHVLGDVVDAAADAGVGVVIGLVRAGYSALPADRLYIGDVGTASSILLAEVARRYAAHPAVRGVYLPQELANGVCDPGVATNCTVCCFECTCCFAPEAARKVLVDTYLGPLSRQAKAANAAWTVWTAPDAYVDRACPPLWPGCNSECDGGKSFCGTPVGTFMPPDAWASWWSRTLADVPDLDVIAHQDGAGDHSSLRNVTAFFTALRRAVDGATPPRQLWSDLEAFAIPAPPPAPGFPTIRESVSPWWRIAAQLDAEAPLVDGFTTWEWHKYFSPLGGPQPDGGDYYRPAPANATVNSNASLHSYLELLRSQGGDGGGGGGGGRVEQGAEDWAQRAHNGGGSRAMGSASSRDSTYDAASGSNVVASDAGRPAPLVLASRHAPYDVHPAPLAGAGNLTDGLPSWCMGGPLPALQAVWPPGAESVRVVVRLPAAVPVASVKLFALRDDAGGVALPESASVSVGGGGAAVALRRTTDRDAAVNVMYALIPAGLRARAGGAVSVVQFDVAAAAGRAVALSEVEIMR